jgi:hypothetical protein
VSAFTGLSKALWGVGKGGWRLRRAARRAERGDGTEVTVDREALAIRPTLPQAALLVRYIAGRFVLGWMQTVFLTKYVFLALAIPSLLGVQWTRSEGWFVERDGLGTAFGIAMLWLFLVFALVQWAASRAVRRVGALDKLADLDDFAFDAVFDWWPNLRAEFRRVGLRPGAWSMLKLGAGYAARRIPADRRAALGRVNWLAVLPTEQLNDAHRVLVRAEGTPADATS